MLLPPQSLRRDVRRTNSFTIKEIARLYSVLISTWLTETEDPNTAHSDTSSETGEDQDETKDEHKKSVVSYAKWTPAFREKLIDVAARLRTLRLQTAASKWEGSFRGEWPFEKYDRLVTAQTVMLNNLVQVRSHLDVISFKY